MVHENTDVLLLDGDCGLCNKLALFMDRNLDLRNKIKFQPIDAGSSQELIKTFPKNQQNQDTVYLYRKQKTYTRSSAAIRCLLYLKWYWKIWFPIFWIVPLPLRDFLYKIIAKHRHRIFSKPKACSFRID
tara:strand:+ start:262 stop:651 length:390 start_codon:yes stop_codon:yes gene_type:complete